MHSIRKIFGITTLVAVASVIYAATVKVPQGTPVTLKFAQALSSRTAKSGQTVKLNVAKDVVVNGTTVLKAGTPVTATISEVGKSDRFGKNAQIKLTINPVNKIPLQPRSKGNSFKGSKTDKAAIASGAGALVLGPIGLVGGYFIKGKSVTVKAGDKLETEVSTTVTINK